ncbi:MAG: cytidine deaminase [Thermomicrobiales bacterium]|nr:cytidine deaminase [Thermomicrobiales bacterium]
MDREAAERLLAEARTAAERAYAPYSGFPVGAAVLTADGTVITGANIENASYSLTICAERVAVFRAVMEGRRAIAAVAIWAARVRPCPPCGACRQVLNEWKPASDEMAVVMEGDEEARITTLSALLPHAFGPHDLAGIDDDA